MRLGARGTQRLTYQLRLALEPECLENPTATARENPQRWSGLDQRHSSCLWFQMLGVEAHSSLPHDQYDRGNLPRQGQARHLRPHALGQQSRVELLERTGFAGSHDRRTLKQILQIVIAVSVESANRDLLLRSLQLSVDTAGDRRCCASRWPNRCSSTAAAWCGNDAASAECPATRPPGSDRSRESGRAVSRPCVSCSRPADPAALPGATTLSASSCW